MSSLTKKHKIEVLEECRKVLLHDPCPSAHAHHHFKLWLNQRMKAGVSAEEIDMQEFYDTISEQSINYKSPYGDYIDRLEDLIDELSKPAPKSNKK